jgi:SSS family solute:Na+ symporter
MIVAAALVVYALALIVIAVLSWKRDASMEDFLVAGRKQRKLFVTASMLASTIGGGITIGTVQKASTMGFPAFWFVAAGGFAHFLQGLLLSRKVRDSEALTLADLSKRMAGAFTQTLTSLIVLVTWIGIAAAQFVAVARVLATLVGIAHAPAVVIAAAFITTYTLIGGQKSVLRTDLFQFGVLALAVITTLAWLYLAVPPAKEVSVELFTSSFGPLDLLYYVAVMGGSYFICPMMFSRILSSDTSANARRSSFLSGTGMFGFAFALTFIGLWVSASGFDTGTLDPLNAIAASFLPKPLGVLLVFGLLAAIVSTADTVLLTASSIVQNDLVKKPSVLMVRVWTVVVGALGATVALFHRDVIGLLMKTYNGYTAGLVPALFVALMFSTFVGGRSERRPQPFLFAAAIISGYILGMAGSFAGSGAIGKMLPLAGMIVSTMLSLAAYGVSDRKPSVQQS